jgi:hypothetical protein
MKVLSNPRARYILKIAVATAFLCPLRMALAQDLSPRAYLITPLRSNAASLTSSFNDGSINLNGVLPASDAKGTYNISVASYYHSFGVFGHSANVVAALPYGVGSFQGTVDGAGQNLYRSGLVDSVYRLAVNLKGGPAVQPREFLKWRQKILLGASLKVIAPTGQYDPTKLINWGTNRWSFKPELGYSERFGNWIADAYVGAWFFTPNNDYWSRNAYYPGTRSLTQKPMASFETHLSYDFKKQGLWVSIDGNYWVGGVTTAGGVEKSDTQVRNSRLGVTAAVPITKHSSLKFSYSDGAHIEFGGNYQNVSVAWQYAWLGKPK